MPAERKEAEISKATGSKGGSGSLSNGAVVGITIGVIALLLLILVLLAFTKCQRRKKKQRQGFGEIRASGSDGPLDSMETTQDYHAMWFYNTFELW